MVTRRAKTNKKIALKLKDRFIAILGESKSKKNLILNFKSKNGKNIYQYGIGIKNV